MIFNFVRQQWCHSLFFKVCPVNSSCCTVYSIFNKVNLKHFCLNTVICCKRDFIFCSVYLLEGYATQIECCQVPDFYFGTCSTDAAFNWGEPLQCSTEHDLIEVNYLNTGRWFISLDPAGLKTNNLQWVQKKYIPRQKYAYFLLCWSYHVKKKEYQNFFTFKTSPVNYNFEFKIKNLLF
jgi:hypothetical protein